MLASKYMAEHKVSEILREITTDLVLMQPTDALKFMHDRIGQVRRLHKCAHSGCAMELDHAIVIRGVTHYRTFVMR